MKKYTVILMRPDYLADPFGHDCYIAHVKAEDHAEAARAAQAEAVEADNHAAEDPEDYYPLAVFPGHHTSAL